MPELPDIELYCEALRERIAGSKLESIRLIQPFLLRSFEPPIEAANDKQVQAISRIGKRIIITLDDNIALVIHLMIAGRLHWRENNQKPFARSALAHFRFSTGTLTLTEAGSKRRASLHVVGGNEQLLRHDPGGLEPFDCSLEQFASRLRRENHTIKRSLTDPHLFSGIGNSFSDEILHHAQISPVQLTSRMTDEQIERLFRSTQLVLRIWIDRLRKQSAGGFPENVTAFRPEMAVHGKFGEPCPVCGTSVQRIRYAENETNYCPKCQTGGKILADRSLSRLLKDDWPRSVDEWEEHFGT